VPLDEPGQRILQQKAPNAHDLHAMKKHKVEKGRKTTHVTLNFCN
jgi:hypothetical protein